jgi:hypothetical protein
VSLAPAHLVPRLGEIALYPLHYYRQISVFPRLYQEMNMISHDAEIPQSEMELPLRLLDEKEE